eukprot:2709078-Prymnesium_polylepis.1
MLMRVARACSYSVGSVLTIDTETLSMPPLDAVSRSPVDGAGVSLKTVLLFPLFGLMHSSVLKLVQPAR